MNFGQIQNLALYWLDDVNGTYFQPTQMQAFVNNAQRECQKQLLLAGSNLYVIKVSTSLIAQQDTYILPTGFMKVHKLEIVLSGTGSTEVRQTLSSTTLVNIDRVSMITGTPVAYTLKKNCFVVRPIPDRAYTCYMHFSPSVSDMSQATDNPDVPVQYHEYLSVLAALDGFIKDDRSPQNILEKKAMYEARMKSEAQNRVVDSPREVIDVDDGGYGYLF